MLIKTILITLAIMAVEVNIDYLQRKKRQKVNHSIGIALRLIGLALTALILPANTLFIYIGMYVSLFNPLINIAWKLGGWLDMGWIQALFYVGSTSQTDKLLWAIFNKFTPIVANFVLFIIGQVIVSFYYQPKVWLSLIGE